ncbi:hypothetical protein ACH5RR_014957 [Cinchona calisaya]|uniref:Uncharacterized protein n=1 Tax=Cinchona calisaya TaxID=153742 RepID=A0ABD2ZX15_9GENT
MQETASQKKTKKIVDEDLELPLFDLDTVSNTTNDFSFTNKIGEVGFGPVYKDFWLIRIPKRHAALQGVLSSRQQIVVKEDSKDSGQGFVKIVKDGNLILQDHMQRILWSTGVQNKSSNGTFLQLLNSGNLVLRNGNSGNSGSYLWQSFDHFSDTWLAGMKLGKDPGPGLVQNLTSWTSPDDPSPGQFTYSVNPRGPPLECVLWKGNSLQYRSGPWNGVGFSGLNFAPNIVFDLKLVVNVDENNYGYVPETKLNTTRAVISNSGVMLRYVWNDTSLQWLLVGTLPNDPCDNYGRCDANSICTISDPTICSCLSGYMPKSQQAWEIHDWSGGCVRNQPLNCSKREGFIELKGVKVPDQWLYWINTSVSLKECEAECLKNCSCTAYANSNILGKGSGCFIWHGHLIDIRQLVRPSAQNLYIRAAASDLAVKIKVHPHSTSMEDLELPTFEIASISKATNNFSDSNKIGEDGFGTVYKVLSRR